MVAALAVMLSGVPRSVAAQISPDPGGGGTVIDPQSDAMGAPSNATGQQATFMLTNQGAARDLFYLGCSVTGQVIHCSVTGSIWVDAGESLPVYVTFSTGDPGTGTVSLSASADNSPGGSGSYTVTVNRFGVATTPDSLWTVVTPNSSTSRNFIVQNTGTATDTYYLSKSCSGSVTCSTLTPTSVTLAPGASATVSLPFTVGSANTVGTVGVIATDYAATDSGWNDVSAQVAGSQVAPAVDTGVEAPTGVFDRGLCLTAAAGPAGAYECGDLIQAEALQGVRTMNKVRSLSLLYNSQTAHPYPLVGANVSLAAGAAIPDSVVAVLMKEPSNVMPPGAHGVWPGSDWIPPTGHTRRIVVGYDASSDSTGVYSYNLIVTNWYGATARSVTLPVHRIVVNRGYHSSPFGAGWWIEGLERYYPSSNLWVGGDGSARIYSPAGANVWKAPNVDHPDSITFDGTDYTRYLPHGIRVLFDAAGRHIATINRLGHRTDFHYDASGLLDTVTVPPSSAGLHYTMTYSAGRLVNIQSPGPTTARATAFTIDTTWRELTRIDFPDTSDVQFAYSSSDHGRMTNRTDGRGYTTLYSYDRGHRLAGYDISSVHGTFQALESYGISGTKSVDTAAAYSKVTGPFSVAPDTSRITRFWLDPYGEPRRIRDALGDTTLLVRGNSTWPALVTRTVAANGRILQAWYNARGYPDSTEDLGRCIGSACAVTRYTWDPKWDFVLTITTPDTATTTFSYDATTGNRLWQQDDRGQASRVTFSYDSALGLLTAIKPPLSGPDSLFYSALGDLRADKPPLSDSVVYVQDRVGRDTLIVTRISEPLLGHSWDIRDRRVYDVMDRLTQSITTAPPDSTTRGLFTGTTVSVDSEYWGAATITVTHRYDKEGNDTSVTRDAYSVRGGTTTRTHNPLTTRWAFDALNRKTKEIAPDGAYDQYTLDAAGNVTIWRTRRGINITMQYDPLNRLTQRTLPQVSYGLESYGGITEPHFVSPLTGQTLNPSGIVIPSDVQSFTYDSVGQLKTAYNNYARINRTYNLDGTIQADTERIRTYAAGSDFSQHVYGLVYSYDIAGRRIAMAHPGTLQPIAAARNKYDEGYGTIPTRTFGTGHTYTYTKTGQLKTITDPLGYVFTFVYDNEDRLAATHYPNGIVDTTIFDNAGREIEHKATSPVHTATIPALYTDSGWVNGIVRDEHLYYDTRGKLVEAAETNVRWYNQYTPLGAVGATEGWYCCHSGGWVLSSRAANEIDPLNNQLARIHWSQGNDVAKDSLQYDATTGRLQWVRGLWLGAYTSNPGTVYDAAGDEHLSEQEQFRNVCDNSSSECAMSDSGASLLSEYKMRAFTANYYAANNQLAFTDRYTVGTPTSYQDAGGVEEYRYDALGRRVLRRFRSNWRYPPLSSADYTGRLTRNIWDGDRLLYEVQTDGLDTASATAMENDSDTAFVSERCTSCVLAHEHGIVAYTHGADMDRPLEAIKVDAWDGDLTRERFDAAEVFFHYNWRGVADRTSVFNGMRDLGIIPSYWRRMTSASENVARTSQIEDEYQWMGSLSGDTPNEDGVAHVYMRNRYYNPATGRFIQEDPMGLAGGLNLYGFANGDPVSYSDPFGLCPPCTGDGDMSGAFMFAGQLLQPFQRVFQPIAEFVASLPLFGMGEMAAGGMSPEVLEMGNVLRTGAGGGILTAAGVAGRVADATGGTVSELAKSEGFKVTVMEGKTQIVARIKMSGDMRVGVAGKGAMTAAGKLSNDPALTHFENLSSEQLTALVNRARDLVRAMRQ